MILALLKAVHLFAAFAWMAGLWYYPRLLIYQCEAFHAEGENSPKIEILRIMEQRLMRVILMPAMGATTVFGIIFSVMGGYFQFGWLHAKLLCVAALMVLSLYFLRLGRQMRQGQYVFSSRILRMLNELPTLILIAILFFVVVYPIL